MLIKEYEFKQKILNKIVEEQYVDFPLVYILGNDKNIYVGETANVNKRMKNHLKNEKRKGMKYVKIIFSEEFNKSATYNIETNLINYLIADESYKLQNVSQTRNKKMHNYYKKDYYDQEVFHLIWDNLYDDKFVSNKIKTLRNKDIYKLSPYKELTREQSELEDDILNFCKEAFKNINNEKSVYIVNGDAGTGKSVLISSLYNTLQDLVADDNSILKDKNNYLLVNHEEVLKTYHKLAKVLPNIKQKNILKPTSFVNKEIESDITIIDEAHLLLSSSDVYNSFKQNNHLEEIIKRSKVVILMFDSKQFLKLKSYWNKDNLSTLISEYANNVTVKELKNQLRMQNAISVNKWIDEFVNCNVRSIPEEEDYDFKVFSNLEGMHQEIIKKNDEFGLSRVVSTFDYEHKKDGKTYYVEELGYKLPWNTLDSKMSWAENNTVNEVGSIYTIQGFDLNYVGVIIGPSVYYDKEKGKLEVDIAKYKDIGAFSTPKNLKNQKNIESIKKQIILNSLNVLLKRGIKGLYIYASDENLRDLLFNKRGIIKVEN